MSVVSKPVKESISVVMKDFAGELYRGVRGIDAKKASELVKQNAKAGLEVLGAQPKTHANAIEKLGSDALKAYTEKDKGFAYKAGDFLGAGIRESYKNYKKMEGESGAITKAIKKAHMTVNKDGKEVLDLKRAAGTFAAVGIGGRVLTGGGLYRDKYGNTNLPGVPFI